MINAKRIFIIVFTCLLSLSINNVYAQNHGSLTIHCHYLDVHNHIFNISQDHIALIKIADYDGNDYQVLDKYSKLVTIKKDMTASEQNGVTTKLMDYIKKNNIEREPIIHGGKSQTNYRSGTPALALMVSTSKALRLALTNFEDKYNHVLRLSNLLKEEIGKIDGVLLNSNSNSIPHIVNISVLGVKPETMLHALEEYDIYISTKTACSKDNSDSLTLTTMGKDSSISGHSIRVSISYLTTEEEIHTFVEKLKSCIEKLKFEVKNYEKK